MSKTRVLTGITTSGTPHLGNYVGAIRPAVTASRDPSVDAFYFLADYHALIKCDDPARIERSRLEIAATWLAAGLDPERVTFYRQSDIPEIPELTWLLTCVTAKGLMNRAHAYKAATDANVVEQQDADAGVTMGLFSYPILMAADILMFKAHRVPVGRDQIQHIEMARDIGARFNHLFGGGREFFVLPEAVIEESVATLPGLDGRKMSKSYDNTIPLFEGGAKRLKDTIARIVTDSKLPGEPKDPDSSHLVTLYQAFASAEESAAFRAALVDGLGWGEAKQRFFERVERDIAPLRSRYETLIARPAEIEELLQLGAKKARAIAAPLLAELRGAVGLRAFTESKRPVDEFERQYNEGLNKVLDAGAPAVEPAEISSPFAWEDKFFFRVRYTSKDDLLSKPFGSAKDAGRAAGTLRTAGLDRIGFVVAATDQSMHMEIRLLLDDEYLARGTGLTHPHDQEFLDKRIALMRESMRQLYEAEAEKKRKKRADGA